MVEQEMKFTRQQVEGWIRETCGIQSLNHFTVNLKNFKANVPAIPRLAVYEGWYRYFEDVFEACRSCKNFNLRNSGPFFIMDDAIKASIALTDYANKMCRR